MGLVLVKNFPDRLYAERAQQTLEADGIGSVLQSLDEGIVGSAPLQGVDLLVEQEDLEEARELLNAVFDGI